MMKLWKPHATILIIACSFLVHVTSASSWNKNDPEVTTGNMVKMCLFYESPSGHARTDPILSQTCSSDHVHTFYGPQNFHPDTTYEDIRDTSPEFSTTPFVENQSLYWHPSIYRRAKNSKKKYQRVSNLDSSPYYRWDNSVLPKPEAFPPKFRMIAYSNQENADKGGETGGNFFVECCNDGKDCITTTGSKMKWPQQNCDMVGIAFAMPTCWNGDLGIDNDHKNHVAYTEDGTVAGKCPTGYDKRLPQVQLFVRIKNYKGTKYDYTFADNGEVFHVDFMNGWKEGTLQTIIDNCQIVDDGTSYNTPCTCNEEFLTENFSIAGQLCDGDVQNLIIDEPTDIVTELPRGSCSGPSIESKSWDINPPINHIPMSITIKGDKRSESKDMNKWRLYQKKSGNKYKKVTKVMKIKQKETTWTQCFPKDKCYKLRMTDKKGNGIPTGFYEIDFGDEFIRDSFDNGKKKDQTINCGD